MLTVFVVSPVPAVRAGLRALLAAADDCEVVGESDRLEVSAVAALPSPGVVVVDAEPGAELPEPDLLGSGGRGPGLVILGPVSGDERLPGELRGRAWGYVSRFAGGEPIVAAVRAVGNGLLAIDPTIGGHLLARAATAANGAPAAEAEDLTGREREVLQLVALGLANKAIAGRLGISEHTVKFHVAAILAKLNAASRTEAVHLGARRGLVVL